MHTIGCRHSHLMTLMIPQTDIVRMCKLYRQTYIKRQAVRSWVHIEGIRYKTYQNTEEDQLQSITLQYIFSVSFLHTVVIKGPLRLLSLCSLMLIRKWQPNLLEKQKSFWKYLLFAVLHILDYWYSKVMLNGKIKAEETIRAFCKPL